MAAHPDSPMPAMTYARSRLYLGASAVGTLSVLAALGVAFDLPSAVPSTALGAGTELAWLALLVAAHAALMAPFDLFGGFLLPREYGRSRESLGRFARRWLRGASVYASMLALSGFALMLASRTFGAGGSVVVFVAIAALLLYAKPRVAELVGAGRIVVPRGASLANDLGGRTRVLMTDAPHVTGGAYGLPGRTAWVVPAHWLRDGERVGLALQLVRRAWLTSTGARDRGVLLALAWTSVPLVAHLVAVGPIVGLADVVRVALWGTLWSFVGVLVLPTPSRWAVYRADAAALEAGFERDALRASLERLEADQDDELERSRGVETIFHPVPAARHRLAAVAGRRDPGPSVLAAWHAARVALYLSVAGCGLLGRAVHCNVGRPEAWVFLPSD
ncbi:MAG: hypothetical protein EA416_03570 [Trueperaceae bacterium]|nr:MAG: hypothetical protein EA416_03570 [Trueperaceae bacterium]